jgi:predicted aspartyl protease
VHIVDEISGKRFLVDTGASFCILPHHSQSPTSGPRLFGPSGQLIPCWGEQLLHVRFQGRDFSWPFLLAAVEFPILGVDFLKHHGLLVDPAKCRLVDGQGASLAALQLPARPQLPW